jgi:Mg-chelatase subunit ChlD
VPGTDDHEIYLVLNDFGAHLGRAWPEADEKRTDREIVIRDLVAAQYSDPVRVVAFNTAEGWSRDVTEEIAEELRQRCSELDEVPESVRDFLSSLP